MQLKRQRCQEKREGEEKECERGKQVEETYILVRQLSYNTTKYIHTQPNLYSKNCKIVHPQLRNKKVSRCFTLKHLKHQLWLLEI